MHISESTNNTQEEDEDDDDWQEGVGEQLYIYRAYLTTNYKKI